MSRIQSPRVPSTPAEIETIRALIAAGNTGTQVGAAVGRTKSSVMHIAARHNLGPWLSPVGYPVRDKSIIPEDFKTLWPTMPLVALARHYRRSASTVGLWAKTLGLVRERKAKAPAPEARKPRLVSTAIRGHKPTLSEIYRDQSPAGLAADILRRDRWIVYRCNEDRRQSQGGKFWMCGRVLCTDAELIERAERTARKLAA